MKPYLSGLGVSLIEQGQVPTQSSFPRKFNPYASSIWSLALEEVNTVTPDKAWTVAVNRYLDLCQAQGTYPFREQGGNNQALIDHLTKCRTLVTKVLEDVHVPLLNQYSILHVKRTASLSPQGFTLRVTSSFILRDPTFRQHLVNCGFSPNASSKMVRLLDAHTEVRFWFSDNRWYVSYIIQGPQFPEMLDRLPPKQRLETFIIEDLWRPLTRDARPDHCGPRFI